MYNALQTTNRLEGVNFTLGKKSCRFTPSKAARCQAAFLESFARAARAQIVASQLFFEQLVAVDDPDSPFDMRFRRESVATFTHGLKRTPVLGTHSSAWYTSVS
jgi:hypothetical protein